MTRIPVPDDYDAPQVTVAGRKDFHYGAADVNLDDEDYARNLTVREDEDGRYVGGAGDHADQVREYLGVDESPGTCDVVKADGEVCGRDLPCPYHSDDEDGDGGDES